MKLTPDQLAEVDRRAREIAQEELVKIWSGQANVQQIIPDDLHYRGKGVYYSGSGGWFAKGPGGGLLKLPGPPVGG